MKMHICSFFNPLLMWREQLTPLMGQEEVDRLYGKLKDLNIKGMAWHTPWSRECLPHSGLETMRIHYCHMFSRPDKMEEKQFWRLLWCVGSWPLVCWRLSFIYWSGLELSGCLWVCPPVSAAAVLPWWLAGPKRKRKGWGNTDQGCSAAAELS